jgi:hypothetical protein
LALLGRICNEDKDTMKDAAFWELENAIADAPRSARDEVMRLRGEVRRLEVDLENTRAEAVLAVAAERERCAAWLEAEGRHDMAYGIRRAMHCGDCGPNA